MALKCLKRDVVHCTVIFWLLCGQQYVTSVAGGKKVRRTTSIQTFFKEGFPLPPKVVCSLVTSNYTVSSANVCCQPETKDIGEK